MALPGPSDRWQISLCVPGDDLRARPLAPVYQLDFRTPGMFPQSAFSRKQIRHMPNRRMYPRARPQIPHRVYPRTANFGVRFCFAIHDFFATAPSLLCSSRHTGLQPAYADSARCNGSPMPSRKAAASSSVWAVVTIVMSIPRWVFTSS